jgi:sarcosine oxidase
MAFKYIVVGKGMIGSAAARHLSASSEGVALIGPDEPKSRTQHQGVFSSHYDEGRIVRILDENQIWATTAKRAVERYRELEHISGVSFFHEVGFLHVTGCDDPEVGQIEGVGKALNAGHGRLSNADLGGRHHYFAAGSDALALYQPNQAGHISPRNMVKAQVTASEKQGACIISSVVRRVRSNGSGVEATTANGDSYRAEKALVATGGFANTLELLPRKLDITVYGRTVVLAKLDERQLEVLESMPSVNYVRKDGLGGYILPPIKYPDGNYYLKMGRGRDSDPSFTNLEDLQKWFQSDGDLEEARSIWNVLESFIPVLKDSLVHTDTCAVTKTRTGYPYIDMIEGTNIGIAVGGNGRAAKSSDEWGRIAALMLSNDEWAYDISAEQFKAVYGN